MLMAKIIIHSHTSEKANAEKERETEKDIAFQYASFNYIVFSVHSAPKPTNHAAIQFTLLLFQINPFLMNS